MPNGNVMNIAREQIPLLPNFAMTDYGSQGRSQPVNIVDLRECRNHQSIYTCLSRGTNSEGTVVLSMCDTNKITGLRAPTRQCKVVDLDLQNLKISMFD